MVIEPVRIGSRCVGPGQPCFIIAEAGVNHNGNLDAAKKMVDCAAEAGADAVKFQTFRAEALATQAAPKAAYQKETTGTVSSQLEMLRRLELGPDDFRALADHASQNKILFLSSPFDEESADLLEALKVPAYKYPSGELTNLPFLAYVARKAKPLIASTGMSSLKEVGAAVRTVSQTPNVPLILLHCVSAYPAREADANLRAMRTLSDAFAVPVGFSDHTKGTEVALAAVALGACVIEKHFTLNAGLPGPDHRASLVPEALKQLVRGIRKVESALGHGRKEPSASEADTARTARKSLVAACDIPKGARLTEQFIAIKRPGTGLSPAVRDSVVGRVSRVPIKAGALISMKMLR